MARISKILLIVSIIFNFQFSIFNSVHAQDSSYVRRVIRDLSSPEMFGRGMQNRGDSIAAEYLRQELRSLGVKPLPTGRNTSAKDEYFQYFRFPNTRTTPPIVRAGYRSQNVCGYIPGETDTMIVFTAHYEHPPSSTLPACATSSAVTIPMSSSSSAARRAASSAAAISPTCRSSR